MLAESENQQQNIKEVLYKDAAAASQPTIDTQQTWETRSDEQNYALLKDKASEIENRYGKKIDLLDITELPKDRSLFINENPVVGDNPNRNKQHGFFFTADNCIGCHACEAACSEKNENPAHIAFRSVGYVEGGSYPDYKRMNISMACNHCDDPVCLKGCPTRAYTKHAEYGAVLQDPETCFGCGYCTWVCPYNAPQLDPVQGQVSKCNMCVDRLEVGLKPACVSACVGNALDFGVIENIPKNREQAKVSIPGFPDPEITQPNIRFQQINGLPEIMTRTDSAPVKYHRDDTGQYKPVIDQKKGKKRFWSFKKLSSRENPLVMFTLLAQAAIGAFSLIFVGAMLDIEGLSRVKQSDVYVPLSVICLLMIGFGMFMSTLHLGKPLRFYRGFNNLRYSSVSREGLGIAFFMTFLSLHILFSLPENSMFVEIYSGLFATPLEAWLSSEITVLLSNIFALLCIVSGITGLYYMNRCYRIKARPFWDHWQVASSFFGNMFSLGAIVAGTVTVLTMMFTQLVYQEALVFFSCLFTLGIAIEGIGLFFHAKEMSQSEHEGAASHYVQLTTFGKSYTFRNIILLMALLGAGVLNLIQPDGFVMLLGWSFIGVMLIISSIIGRALFYVLVIPTTMPGAFFWKNKQFEQHARDIGLANMPQVGVVPDSH